MKKKYSTINSCMLLSIIIYLGAVSCASKENSDPQTTEGTTKSIQSYVDSPKEEMLDSITYTAEILSSSIDLSDDSRWQLVAASQNYGTNYAVFGKFELNTTKDTIVNAFFKIRNYKQLVRIGLVNVKMHPTTKGNIQIEVYVQGLNAGKTYDLANANVAISSKKGFVNSERYLIPMFVVAKDDVEPEKLSRYFMRMTKDDQGRVLDTILFAEHTNNLVYDREFFYLDGSQHILPKYDYDADPDNRTNPDKLPGFRCRTGKFKIVGL